MWRRLHTEGKSCATEGGDSECISVNAARPVLAATHNAGRKHWGEGIVVELKDEGEHQVELLVVLGGEVEADNGASGFDRLRVLVASFDRNAGQRACLGSVGCSRDFA